MTIRENQNKTAWEQYEHRSEASSFRPSCMSVKQLGHTKPTLIELFLNRDVVFFRFIFDVEHLKSLCWIVYNMASVIYVLVFWLRGMWDLSFQIRNRTCTPFIGRWSSNYWTAREVPTEMQLTYNIILVAGIHQNDFQYVQQNDLQQNDYCNMFN